MHNLNAVQVFVSFVLRPATPSLSGDMYSPMSSSEDFPFVRPEASATKSSTRKSGRPSSLLGDPIGPTCNAELATRTFLFLRPRPGGPYIVPLTSVWYAMTPKISGTTATYTNVRRAVRGVQRKYMCRFDVMARFVSVSYQSIAFYSTTTRVRSVPESAR